MDKKLIAFIILALFLIIGLTGCYTRDDAAGEDTDGDSYPDSEDEFPNDPDEWSDRDKDGFGDNEDDFPTNASLHEINYLYDSIGPEKKDDPWLLSSGESQDFTWSVTNEWKFVYVNTSTSENVNGEWSFQPVCPKITLTSPVNTYTINIGNPLSRIPITTENSGDWEFKIVNSCDNQIRVNFAILMYR
jgi:hypothetical protein